MLPLRIEKLLDTWRHKQWIRKRTAINRQQGIHIQIQDKMLINFASSDYLDIATHPAVKKAFINGARDYGLGSTSAALIAGYSPIHQALEEAFAEFLGRENALLFNSGYHANLGVISALTDRHSVIVADKCCHASIIDGMTLSPAKHVRYQHNHFQQAADLLIQHKHKNKLLITESVFSMHGNITDAKSLSLLAKQHQALLMIDDAHGIGVLGSSGKGIIEQAALTTADLPLLITPLGKAMGSMGAIVSGSKELIEAVLQFARTYRYSTALPPAVCLASLAALNVLNRESWRREKLTNLIRIFIEGAKARQLNLLSFDETPIKCLPMSDSARTLQIQQELIDNGFYVSCIRPPTTTHAGLIRISLTAAHKEEHILRLLDCLRNKIL